jgi:xylose isomerase
MALAVLKKKNRAPAINSGPTMHSFCPWFINDGKARFTPVSRPEWTNISTVEKIALIRSEVLPRLPENIIPGFELHVPGEVDRRNVREVVRELNKKPRIYIAMATPGAHGLYGYGGIASLDPRELIGARKLGNDTVDLLYGPLRAAWHEAPHKAPTLVLWNGSWGVDLEHPLIDEQYEALYTSIAGLCEYEEKVAQKAAIEEKARARIAKEPKPSEGQPRMLEANVAEAINGWYVLNQFYGVPLARKGINEEDGHSNMGFDCLPTNAVLQLNFARIVEKAGGEFEIPHHHYNTQGSKHPVKKGEGGQYDIDWEFAVSGPAIARAAIWSTNNIRLRWGGHDCQPRPEDNPERALDRLVRAAIAYEACHAEGKLIQPNELRRYFSSRDTVAAEDYLLAHLAHASEVFRKTYDASKS